jgi:hypothetical protein
MREVELEFTCIYARNYNLMLRVKEAEEYDEGFVDQLRTLVSREIQDKQTQVVEDFCFSCHPNGHDERTAGHKQESINMSQFESWVEKFADEPFMTKQRDQMEKLNVDLFERQRIEHLSFEEDIPESLTAEKYLQMYKKIWAIMRHDLWKAC